MGIKVASNPDDSIFSMPTPGEMVLPFYLSRLKHNPLAESSGWRADPCFEKGFDVWICRNMCHLGGGIVCVSSASWGQLDGFLWVGKAVGEEKKGVCMVRGGKAVCVLRKRLRLGGCLGQGGGPMGCNGGCGRGLVLSPESCSHVPKTACGVQRTSQEQRYVLAVGGRAAPPGSASRGLRWQVHSGLGTNPAWQARNLLRLKQEQPQRDSAQPLVSVSLSFA